MPFNDTRGKGYALAATGTYAGVLAVNYGGGGQGIPPSLPRLIRIQLQGVAFIALAA